MSAVMFMFFFGCLCDGLLVVPLPPRFLVKHVVRYLGSFLLHAVLRPPSLSNTQHSVV